MPLCREHTELRNTATDSVTIRFSRRKLSDGGLACQNLKRVNDAERPPRDAERLARPLRRPRAPTVEKPSQIIVSGVARMMAEGHCRWSGTLECFEDKDAPGGDSIQLQRVELLCSDDWTVIFQGEIDGEKITRPLPITLSDWWAVIADVVQKLKADPVGELPRQLIAAGADVTCASEDCPKILVRIFLWPIKIKQVANQKGTFEFYASVRCRIEAKCSI